LSGPTPEIGGIVSVVLPVRNAESTIGAQLQALAEQDYPGEWEVVVADNESTDRTRLIIQSWNDRIPSLTIVDANGPRQQSHALNCGVRAARGVHLLFCDADDVVDTSWITAMTSALVHYDGVGGRIDVDRLNDDLSRSYRNRWLPGPGWIRLADTSARVLRNVPPKRIWAKGADWVGSRLADNRPGMPVAALPIVSNFLPRPFGANCGVRRAVWEQLDGFDENFRTSADTEFFWRLQLEGFSLGFVPGALVHYRLRSSALGVARQYFRWGVTAALLYKNFRGRGLTRDPLIPQLRQWAQLLPRTLFCLPSRMARALWLRDLSLLSGRLVGGIKYRVPFW
jgi:glycosyltransferase involved in cell wall biosynthesis